MSSITLFDGEPSFDEDIDDCHPREFKSSFVHAREVMFLGKLISEGLYNQKTWWPQTPSNLSILEAALNRYWRKYEVQPKEEKVVGCAGDMDIIREVRVVRRAPVKRDPKRYA